MIFQLKTKPIITFAILVATLFSSASSLAQSEPPHAVMAPNVLFETSSGEQFELQQRWQHKPVLMYFWATWCPYCKKATPLVVALDNNYGDKIEVLAVNIGVNDSPQKMQEYIDNYGMQFPVMFDHQSLVSQRFSVAGTPAFVLISPNGEIVYRSHQYPMGIEAILVDSNE